MESRRSVVSNGGSIVRSAVVSGVCLLATVCGLANGAATRRAASSLECKDPFLLTEAQVPLLSSRVASGDVQAQCLLGFAYHRGSSLKKDDIEAAKWLLKRPTQEFL
jgi:TPR repeat protein